MLTTALVASGVVALGTATALGEPHTGDLTMRSTSNYDDITTRSGDRASRGDVHSTVTTANQPAPDVWILPLRKYTLTSFYGERWGRLHPGAAQGAAQGTPFVAVAAGKVILCRWNAGYGYNVMIDHGDGIVTVYGHASKLLCKEGEQVRAGDQLALVGNTGHSFGSHLHFEVRQNDRAPVFHAQTRRGHPETHGSDLFVNSFRAFPARRCPLVRIMRATSPIAADPVHIMRFGSRLESATLEPEYGCQPRSSRSPARRRFRVHGGR
ncbi:M23 family metallopeptidase [Dactylosporangium sp. McL0621]|uniref:M23 family metallopeptidase n=1 Tax=Dactylosporangium sp. McL0621 TaxID=3415678 RepID=UPI003CECE96C